MEPSTDADKARLALDIVLKRVPHLTTGITDIISIQLTCSGWRTVLRAAATHTSIITVPSKHLKDADSIQAVGAWIEQHAELLGSLQLQRKAMWPKFCCDASGCSECSRALVSESSADDFDDTRGQQHFEPSSYSDSYYGQPPYHSSSRGSSNSSIGSLCCTCGPDASESALTAAMQAATAAGMQLQHFASNFGHSPELLLCLPATLRQLHLHNSMGAADIKLLQSFATATAASVGGSSSNTASATRSSSRLTGLSRFTALHSLTITAAHSHCPLHCGDDEYLSGSSSAAGGGGGDTGSTAAPPNNHGAAASATASKAPTSTDLMSVLHSLPALRTLLVGGARISPSAFGQLPSALTSLVLDNCRITSSGPAGNDSVMDLAHMSSLGRLDVLGAAASDPATWGGSDMVAAVNMRLPPSLTALTLLSARQPGHTTLNLATLQSLQEIALLDSRERPVWLMQLGSLPAMKHIHLRYLSRNSLMVAAPAWANLSALKTLELHHIVLPQHWQQQELLRCLAAATNLTALRIDKLSTKTPIALCGTLTGMHKTLASLSLDWVDLKKSDPMSLTCLTGLTSLSLVKCGPAVDDVAAVAICMHLRQLRSLVLQDYEGLASLGLLYPVSEVLKNLETLCISGRHSCVANESHVAMLTGLKQLRRLSLPGNPDCLAAAVRGLRAAVPGLRDGGDRADAVTITQW